MEHSVCICGAGTMGRGIALAIAGKGIPVRLYDLKSEIVSAAPALIEKELEQESARKRMTMDEKIKTSRHISYTSSLSDCRATLIVEAIAEKTEVKSALFRDLEKFNQQETIFATNTSSLSVTAIAEQTGFPERIIGLHFFNPANRMKLVEIVRTKYVSGELVKHMKDFVSRLEKTPVVCQDNPGFIVNHVARPFYLEALRLAEKEITDISSIDKLLESAGFKMGPFHLMDLIGQDINYSVSRSLYEAFGQPERLKPSGLQEEKVIKGLLGKKTGSGFFQYTKPVTE